ncbi:MAG: flavin reductase family protein [Clostridia bacterium]|nr:flavin reductase family protein [Clostridia bacterium]
MAKVHWKGSTLLAPVPPAMVTCSRGDEINIITVAWTGIVNSQPPKTYISVRPSRHSHEMIRASREFAIHLTPKKLVRAADWCGIHTGAKVNKFERCHLTPEPASVISAPLIAECPVALECRVTDVIPLGSHDMFLADIVAVDADERLLDGEGKLRMERADLVAYAHGDYYELGRRLGAFGFSVAKKRPGSKKS